MKRIDKLILGFVVLFLYFSGIDKLFHYRGFTTALNDYKFVPFPLGFLLAPVVIGIELSLATAMLFRRWRTRASIHAAIFVAVLSSAFVANRILGGEGLCGCWYSLGALPDHLHVVLNVLLIGLLLSVATQRPQQGLA